MLFKRGGRVHLLALKERPCQLLLKVTNETNNCFPCDSVAFLLLFILLDLFANVKAIVEFGKIPFFC